MICLWSYLEKTQAVQEMYGDIILQALFSTDQG